MVDGMTIARAEAPDTDDDFMLDLAGRAAAVDRSGSFPWESLDTLRYEQMLALTARPQDGGEGAGLLRCTAVVQQAGRGCASTALILAMHLIHVRVATGPAWPEHLRTAVGRGAGRYGALINALRVEPALGTPARGGLPDTIARQTPDGWAITGRKIYSTGAPGLAWMLVFARTDGDAPRTGLFLVPASARGITIVETWDQMGLRGSGSHDVVFDDVAVPRDHAVDLRAPADWMRPDPAGAAWNALMVAAVYTGVAEAARDWVSGFLRARAPSSLGALLATLPRMQEAMGRIEALLMTNRRLIAGAATETDAGRPPAAAETGLIKTVAADNAIAAVQAALALAGNHGLSRANPLERHLRDVMCARIHTPQPDAAFTAAGRLVLGA